MSIPEQEEVNSQDRASPVLRVARVTRGEFVVQLQEMLEYLQ